MGSDRQQIIDVDYPNDPSLITVKCVYPGGCFRIGDIESNLPRRYEFVRHGKIGEPPMVIDAEFEEIN